MSVTGVGHGQSLGHIATNHGAAAVLETGFSASFKHAALQGSTAIITQSVVASYAMPGIADVTIRASITIRLSLTGGQTPATQQLSCPCPHGADDVAPHPYPGTDGPSNPGQPPVDGGGPQPPTHGHCPVTGDYGPNPGEGHGEELLRLFDPDYGDGKGSMAGADRPNAREISNAVHKADGDKPNASGASDLFWGWGQFLDHDLSATHSGGDRHNIDIPEGDPRFDPDGTGDKSLGFTRSEHVIDENGVRQQVNSITPLIDGSNVYGSSEDEEHALRSFDGGKLVMSADGNLPRDENGFFKAGDGRVNENPVLTGLHTVFAREHNRIADEVSAQYPTWSDQQIFDEARRINVGQMQSITQNEFLPVLLGPDAMGAYGGYTGENAQISNEFSSAAFRFGHTLVSDQLRLVDEHGNAQEIPLSQAFFNPAVINEGGIDDVLRGAASQQAQAMDTELVDGLRDNVIPGPSAHPLDLAALNIQRGRDHGMPSLNDARRGLGLPPLTGFDDPRLRDGVGDKLAAIYDNIEEVDLWTGMLAERPVGAGMAGETQAHVLADQFHRTRAGDPDWYERSFTPQQVATFNSTRLSDIIERNSTDTEIQDYAMLVPGHGCDVQPVPEHWKGMPQEIIAQLQGFLAELRDL